MYFSSELKAQGLRKWKPLIDEMTEWPFSKHDDIPDAISDVDKRDKNNKLYCPGPPAGWRTAAIKVYRPPVVDGRYNSEAAYPAREFTKAQHSGAQRGPELWRQLSESGAADAQTSRNQSIFQRPAPPPTQWDKSS